MQIKGTLVIAAAMLAAGGIAQAGQPGPTVVLVRYVISEQVPDRAEVTVAEPLTRALKAMARAAEVNCVIGHGFVTVEIAFDGGATEHDRLAVRQRINALVLDPGVVVTSRTVTLSAPTPGF